MISTLSAKTGYVHSVETCGTVDGPGIRFIVFTAGCPLRCLYCCNPDCRHLEDGHPVGVDELMTEIQKYTPYMKASGGGVTVCGGEPLFQPQFVREIFKQCKARNIHTALDTSGFCELSNAIPVLEFTDLVLLDIKSFDANTYYKVTGVSIEPTLTLARYLDQIHKPVWIRFVLVPGLTDDPQNIAGLADFLTTFTNVEKIDVLPFHKMGEYKWEQLGYEYLLKDTPPPTPEQVKAAIEIFKSRNLNAM